MEPFELDGAADHMFRRAGIDPASAPGALRLLMQAGTITVHFTASVRTPRFVPANDVDPPTIYIPQVHRLTRDGLNWLTAHETGESLSQSIASEERERYANAIAASIVAPRSAMLRARERWGLADLVTPADRFKVSQTIIALRLGEVWDLPVVVTWGGRVVRRGINGDVIDGEVRKIVRAGGCREFRLVRFTDARRVALISTGEE